jgi:lipopolysaccharide export system ATP-binding protein
MGDQTGRVHGSTDDIVETPRARGALAPTVADATARATAGLRVNLINKAYGGRKVVNNVSLHLARGEVAGLLGPNGAGKTTCFYMITGLIAVDTGTITLDGQDITGLPMYERARLGVGYLPQETSVFRGLTVEQNIMAIVEMREPSRHRTREITEELLAELHLEPLREVAAVSLSGGELRRVEIARALAVDPAFMLLDEPFAGVDPLAIDDLRDVIGYLKRRGLGILITDHNVHVTLEIVERATIIHAGEVLFEGAPDAVIHNADVRRLYLGERYK